MAWILAAGRARCGPRFGASEVTGDMAATCLHGLVPNTYRAHALHSPQSNWPETNCYVDLWIEVLHSLGFTPQAALGFTVTQDFEGDQFTFSKFPLEDLATLFGLHVQELAIYDRVEAHTLEQLQRGRLVLVEVDSFYLPDTQGTSYRSTHGKTTIAINHLDSAQRRLHYFHNAGYFALAGDDFDGILRPASDNALATLFPYVEFVKRSNAPHVDALPELAVGLLRSHLQLRPMRNPLHVYQQAFPLHAEQLAQRPMEYFHLYAFNTLRQVGANFELLSSHLSWLAEQGELGLQTAIDAANEVAGGAKVLQFQLARAVAKKNFERFIDGLTPLANAYDVTLSTLVSRYTN